MTATSSALKIQVSGVIAGYGRSLAQLDERVEAERNQGYGDEYLKRIHGRLCGCAFARAWLDRDRLLTVLLEPDPRACSHMHYVNHARSQRVYGAICQKMDRPGADRAFGAPESEELAMTMGAFRALLTAKPFTGATRAHELHGPIYQSYLAYKEDRSCLGLPISNEEPTPNGRPNRFEDGLIAWTRNAAKAELVAEFSRRASASFRKEPMRDSGSGLVAWCSTATSKGVRA